MKIMIVIIGILTIFAGILPFLDSFGILPAGVPSSGPFYSGVIILIGIIGVLYGIKSKMWSKASHRFIASCLGILIIFGGIIPFLSSMKLIPSLIPSSGPLYSGLIILIGILAVFYGAKKYL